MVILFMKCKLGFAFSLHKSKNSIRKSVLLNIYLIILMVICWEHCLFFILIGCKGGSRAGSGMNTGCHGVAFCLWEIFEYLPVGICYHRCCAKYIFFASGTSLCLLFRDKRYKVLRHWGQVCVSFTHTHETQQTKKWPNSQLHLPWFSSSVSGKANKASLWKVSFIPGHTCVIGGWWVEVVCLFEMRYVTSRDTKSILHVT